MTQSSGSVSANQKTPLRVLFFEDDPNDIELCLRMLQGSQFDVSADVVSSTEEFLSRLRSATYDLILADYRMPGATGLDAFDLMKAEGLDIPFILVTGTIGDEKAVECLKEGVADYVLKDRLARLPVAICRALDEQRRRQARAEADEVLRQSEASYRSLTQSAPCGILRLSAEDGRLLEVNPALAGMLGYPSAPELLRRSGADGIALDPQTCASMVLEFERTGKVTETEIQWRRSDGTSILLRLSGRLLRNQQEKSCFELIAENATERKQAEERIRHLNCLYSVLSHAGDAIVHIRDGTKLFERICRILVDEGGYRMAWVGIVDSVSGAVQPLAHAGMELGYLDGVGISVSDRWADHGPVATAIRESRPVLCIDLANDPVTRPWRDRAVERGYRSLGAFPIIVRGKTIGAIAIYDSPGPSAFEQEQVALLNELAGNLSFALESIEAEQRRNRAIEEMNQFFALSREMLCISNLQGYMHRVNPAWEKTLGFSAAETSSRPWTDFVHPDDRPLATQALRGLQSGIAMSALELRYLSRDGTCKWLLGSATAVLKEGLVFAAIRDITDRKGMEDQLRRQNRLLEEQAHQAEAANRMKSEFLANMSHELRSPLNGIIGFTELIHDGRVGPVMPVQKDCLDRILKSARHLLQLINGVLDLSKIEAGRMESRPERVSLHGVVREVAGILSPLAVEKSIRIETQLDPAVAEVTTDPAHLKEILYNYLSNAIKFTATGGKVCVSTKAAGEDDFLLEVSDTGIGIPANEIGRLFVEFQQLDAGAAKRHQGTGLGLALTRRIVEASGGRVGVRSEPGKGSTFLAVLSRSGKKSETPDAVPNILVIEDERSQSRMLRRTLEKAGYHVDTAGCCGEAMAKCRAHKFHAITLDILLPDGQGLHLVDPIRETVNADTPIVVVSALAEEDLRTPARVQAYVRKPVDLERLLTVFQEHGVPRRTVEVENEQTVHPGC